MVWFPGHTITYAVMAPHRRIPWMAFLSFFYMCILSFTRGGGGGASVAGGTDALDIHTCMMHVMHVDLHVRRDSILETSRIYRAAEQSLF